MVSDWQLSAWKYRIEFTSRILKLLLMRWFMFKILDSKLTELLKSLRYKFSILLSVPIKDKSQVQLPGLSNVFTCDIKYLSIAQFHLLSPRYVKIAVGRTVILT